MNAKYGSAGAADPSNPTDAPGEVPVVLDSSDIDTDALQGILDGINADPKSLDLVLLAPLRDQLEEFENDPEEDWTEDPAVRMLSQVVSAIVQVQTQRLNDLAAECMGEFFDCVEASNDPRQSMIDDERQIRAISRVRDSKRYAGDAADRDSTDDDRINMHTTRTRTTMYGARLGDVIFPTNDYPLRFVAPSDPKPEEYPGYAAALAQAMAEAAATAAKAPQTGPNGSPLPPAPALPPELVLSIKDYADAAAAKMQAWAFAQFDAQHFTKKGREVIERGCSVGLGLMYGPFPDIDRRRVPKMKPLAEGVQDGMQGMYLDLEVEESKTPGIESRDPFRFFYDLTKTLEESNSCYYVNLWTVRQLNDFKSSPRVIVPTVEKMLKEKDPVIPAKLLTAINRRADGSGMKEVTKGRYVVVEVDTIMRPETLKQVTGIEWDHDDLPQVKLWISEEGCLKFKITPLERDWRPPYYNFGMMPKDDTIYWYSVPAMGRSGQKFIDAALNATLFNAAAARAPIIVTNKGQVQPNNERWRLGDVIVFNNLNPDLPAKDVFASVQVQSNVDGNLKMLAEALAMFDDDILYEQILSGNLSGEAIAASQLAQIVNLASVWQRRLAGYADDYLLQPIGERFMWWGNIYGEDDDMKGPHVVKAIAATQFVSKDILIQHLQALTQLATQTPDFRGFADPYKLFRLNTNLLDIPDIDDVVYPREKALENQKQLQAGQQGPEAVKMADVERQAKKDEADYNVAMEKIRSDASLQVMRENAETQRQQLKLKQALIELATAKEVDFAKLDADMAQTTQDNVVYAKLESLKLAATPSPYSAKD